MGLVWEKLVARMENRVACACARVAGLSGFVGSFSHPFSPSFTPITRQERKERRKRGQRAWSLISFPLFLL